MEIILISLFIIVSLWLFIACLADLLRKSEKAFPKRREWGGTFILSLIFGFYIIPTVIYIILHKPNILFWKRK